VGSGRPASHTERALAIYARPNFTLLRPSDLREIILTTSRLEGHQATLLMAFGCVRGRAKIGAPDLSDGALDFSASILYNVVYRGSSPVHHNREALRTARQKKEGGCMSSSDLVRTVLYPLGTSLLSPGSGRYLCPASAATQRA